MKSVHFRKIDTRLSFEFARAAHDLVSALERAGFHVQPMPEHYYGVSATHANPGAITLFLLSNSELVKEWQVL